MDADTYSNAGVIEYSNKGFVNVSVYLDAPNAIATRFGVDAIPATFLVTSEGERVRAWEGYLGPEEYKKALEGGVSTHKKIKEVLVKLKADPDSLDLTNNTVKVPAGGYHLFGFEDNDLPGNCGAPKKLFTVPLAYQRQVRPSRQYRGGSRRLVGAARWLERDGAAIRAGVRSLR